MAQKVPKSTDPARKAASRVMLACGLLLGLLVALGITGLASVTLFYIELDAGTAHDSFERSVIAVVRFFDGWSEDGSRLRLIHHVHALGGFAAMVLTGWAAIEIWSAARLFRTHLLERVRAQARWMRPLAIIGAVALELALVAQLLTGTAARAALDELRVPSPLQAPPTVREAERIAGAIAAEHAASKDDAVVLAHMRELNYPLGFGALLLLLAAMLARRAAIVLDSEPTKELDVSIDKAKQV